MSFPRHIPCGSNCPNQPPGLETIYQDNLAALKTWDVKKLLLVHDWDDLSVEDLSGPLNKERIDYAESLYANMSSSCIGLSGHLAAEDTPYNIAKRIIEWGQDNGFF